MAISNMIARSYKNEPVYPVFSPAGERVCMQWCISTGTEWNGVPVDFFKPQVSGTAVPVEKIPRIVLNICETSAFSMLSF